MERQVYGPHPVTGIVCHHYVWIGKGEVTDLRGMPVIPRASITGTKHTGRKIDRRAA